MRFTIVRPRQPLRAWLYCAPLLLAIGQAQASEPPLRAQGMSRLPQAASAPLPAPGTRTVALDAMVAAARRDAAQRTGQPEDTLAVRSAERVDWPDGGLGCPQPGVRYTMALVPGYRILIQTGDTSLHYHASERGSLLLCPGGASARPPPNSRI